MTFMHLRVEPGSFPCMLRWWRLIAWDKCSPAGTIYLHRKHVIPLGGTDGELVMDYRPSTNTWGLWDIRSMRKHQPPCNTTNVFRCARNWGSSHDGELDSRWKTLRNAPTFEAFNRTDAFKKSLFNLTCLPADPSALYVTRDSPVQIFSNMPG